MRIATQEQIRSLIDLNAEESLFLEFKSGEALDKTDAKRRDIAKDVSAFANSAGGILIYGIVESDHKAASISTVDGSVYTKEWLQQVIHSNISRHIDGLEIVPIRIDGDVKKTVYAVHIPESSNVPHMASDKKYYRRYNVECVPMEEYEIRNLYARMSRAKLTLEPVKISPGGTSTAATKIREIRFRLEFLVTNIGRVIERDFKLEVKIPGLINYEIDKDIFANRSLTRTEVNHKIFSISNASPIFPEETLIAAGATIKVEKGTWHHIKHTNPGMIVRLYYSNGIIEQEVHLANELSYGGQILEMEMFVS